MARKSVLTSLRETPNQSHSYIYREATKASLGEKDLILKPW